MQQDSHFYAASEPPMQQPTYYYSQPPKQVHPSAQTFAFHGTPSSIEHPPPTAPPQKDPTPVASNPFGLVRAFVQKYLVCIIICLFGIIVVVVAAIVVPLVLFLPGSTLVPASVTITIQSANTKQLWMTNMMNEFNSKSIALVRNKGIAKVNVVHTGSTFKPDLNPHIYSPANDEWIAGSDLAGYISATGITKCKSLTNIPLGIAMWKPMAEALGWPTGRISFREIALLANSTGWVTKGRPEWGSFKYGHGHPKFSNSGRLSVTSSLYAFNNIPSHRQLTLDDVNSANSSMAVRNMALSVFHMGQIDTDLLDKMVSKGASYLHAVANYESNVIRYNLDHSSTLQYPLVMIYPSDGTFYVNHPICILDSASYANDAHKEVAEMFIDYITKTEQQQALIRTGVRAADTKLSLDFTGTPFTTTNGVISTVSAETVRTLAIPSASLTTQILNLWQQQKKEAAIIMIVDVSGSMLGQKIRSVSTAGVSFVQSMSDKDSLHLCLFSSTVNWVSSVQGLVSSVRASAVSTLSGLIASGGTALYDAAWAGVQRSNEIRASDLSQKIRRNYAIILLTDGQDTNSLTYRSVESLLQALPDGSEADQVHIHTIAYGNDADQDVLKRISTRTNGVALVGSPSNIETIYTTVSMEY